MIKIEKNIRVPKGYKPLTGRAYTYPWPGLKKGDSFFVPVTDPAKLRQKKRTIGCSRGVFIRKTGRKFSDYLIYIDTNADGDQGIRAKRVK